MTVMDEINAKPSNNGKDALGRFAPGHKLARGNPHAKRVHRNRSIFLRAITEEDMQQITAALVRKAKTGDVQAITTAFNYALGKPSDEHSADERAKLVQMFLNQVNNVTVVQAEPQRMRGESSADTAHDQRTNEAEQMQAKQHTPSAQTEPPEPR